MKIRPPTPTRRVEPGKRLSRKRDPLDMAVSLDTPLDGEDSSEETIGAMREDCTATQSFEEVQQRIWVGQLHDVLEVALNELPEEEHAVI